MKEQFKWEQDNEDLKDGDDRPLWELTDGLYPGAEMPPDNIFRFAILHKSGVESSKKARNNEKS